MPLVTSRGVGQYVASEAHTFLTNRLWKNGTARRPIIYFTGGPGDDRDFITATASGSQVPSVLAESGFPIVSAAFGGANMWGNDTSIARIGSAWTYIKSQLSPSTDKFIGVGVSKGVTALLNYAKANPSNVAAIAGFVPAVDIQDIYTNDRAGAASSISTAYGGAPPDDHTPAKNAASYTGIPIKLWYQSDDTTVIPSTVTTFAATAGATTVNTGTGGHTAANVDAVQVAAFLAAYA